MLFHTLTALILLTHGENQDSFKKCFLFDLMSIQIEFDRTGYLYVLDALYF